MAYRSERAALEERRASIRQQLEDIRTSAKRERALEEELREIEASLDATERTFLDDLRIASPCSASWDDMTGDDKQRFCKKCEKHVYNVAGMSREEAEALIASSETTPCLRLSRRADGTVITNDCPVGARSKRVRLAVLSAAGGGALAFATWQAMKPTCANVTMGAPLAYPSTVVIGSAAPEPPRPPTTDVMGEPLPVGPPVTTPRGRGKR